MLAKTNKNAPRPVWTLSKLADSFVQSSDKNVLKEQPNSISTGRNMEEIVRNWTTPRNKHESQLWLFDDI
jgi:bifunctional non-homologous end joining protein LigD